MLPTHTNMAVPKAEGRVMRLAAHLLPCDGDTAGMEGLPTSVASQGVVTELQNLLEHDSHGERQAMKDLMAQPLFRPCAVCRRRWS